jgi:ABC-2 type transport system permease protein
MTDPTGAVYDLGYEPYVGERSGRRGAIATTFRDGVFRIYGFKRKGRKKIVPFLLLALAVVPALAFVALTFLAPQTVELEGEVSGFTAEYFGQVGALVVLFVGLAAPELLVWDRRWGVLSIYSSRPLSSNDYVTARVLALLAGMMLFLVIPPVLTEIGIAALSTESFVSAVVNDVDGLIRILGTAGIFAIGYGLPALLIAAFAQRKFTAFFVYLGVMLVGSLLAGFLVDASSFSGRRFAALLAIAEHPGYVLDWIYGRVGVDNVVYRAGFDPWVSLVVVLLIAIASVTAISLRYRRLM